MTDIVKAPEGLTVAQMLYQMQPEPDIQDIERIEQLVQISALMASERLPHSKAVERVGLNRSTVHRWRSERPWVHAIASMVVLGRLDREIEDTVLASWPKIIRGLVDDATSPDVEPKDRRSAAITLHKLVVEPLAVQLETVETAMADSKEQKLAVRKRRQFAPVRLAVVEQLDDGRFRLAADKED